MQLRLARVILSVVLQIRAAGWEHVAPAYQADSIYYTRHHGEYISMMGEIGYLPLWRMSERKVRKERA